jgi:N-acetylmuramoyl-L-alanine amidase
MRKIKKIIVHCSATPESMDVGSEEIRRWHKERGWSDIGYHDVIRRDGTLEKGRDISIAGAHAKGHNFSSIGVCLIGGVDGNGKSEDNFAIIQKQNLRVYLDFMLLRFPDAEILGHRDIEGVKKECPCFNVREWYNG